MVKAVLLDIDGTLIDSNNAHARAFERAFWQHGHTVPFTRIRTLIGKGSDHLIPEVAGFSADSHEGKAVSSDKKKIFHAEYLPELRPFPGVRTLLKKLKEQGAQLVVATSASDDDLEALLGVIGIEDLVTSKTSKDSVENSKPEPDVVEEALKKAKCQADEAVMIGDTPYDLEACRKAGVRMIGLECGGWDADDLSGAAEVFKDPADLLAHLETSLLAEVNKQT